MNSILCVCKCARFSIPFTVIGMVLSLGIVSPVIADQPKHPVRTLLENQCYDCHQGESAEAGLDLEKLTFDLNNAGTLRRWVRIYDRVESGEMPPADYAELEPQAKSKFLEVTRQGLVDHQTKLHKTLGRVRGRRLTRKQIERSLQDLLAIDIPLKNLLPEEAKTEGFTTVADGQGMSYFQIAAHLNAVDAALDEAFRRALSPEDEYQRDFDAQGVCRTNPKRRCREPEMRNGQAVIWSGGPIYYGRMPATSAPEDGWYRFEVTVSGLKLPKTGGVWSTVRTGPCVSSAPLLEDVTTFEAMKEPKTIEFIAWLPKRDMLEIRPGDRTLKRGRFPGGQVGTGEGEDQDIPGIAFDRVVMERIHTNGDDDQVRQSLFGDLKVEASKDKREPWQVISTNPRNDAETLLTAFASRAFRRPVTASEIEPYLAEVDAAFASKVKFMDALRLGYRALLCSPRFLYFTEEPGTLDDWEIATRLSYFIDGSMPDAELNKLAAAGKLHEPKVLKQQVRRLLEGERGDQFLKDFAAEWLELDQIDFTQPDTKLFGRFDTVVQDAMLAETEKFLQTMLHENLSVTHLIDADFTFLNSRLARYYDIDGIPGDELRRVALDPKTHRGGVLTQGAIMKVTANGSNTSPVVRGVWVSERLLGVDIPPPPSNVPAVEPDIRGATTIREQLAKHRSQGECASCHAKIDPAGFALENFDPTGRWRDNYYVTNGRKVKTGPSIDPSYEMPDGQKFENIDDFRSLVVQNPQRLAANVAEKLLMYGTGGVIEFADREAVEKIAQKSATDDYGLRTLVEEVAVSPLFLSK